MNQVFNFIKKEIVLCIAIILAVLSMFFVKPDRQYLAYIDFRTLAILFCLMTIVAGFKQLGFFDLLAEKLLSAAKGVKATVAVLVFLCFFLSMLITNDVALITFVPFTITVMKKMEEPIRQRWMLPVIVMQTIAANLGSMFTPIGNPQNLYLFGLTDFNTLEFLSLMLPYTGVSFLLLLVWILCWEGKSKMTDGGYRGEHVRIMTGQNDREKTLVYSLLLLLSLLTVGRILPYWMALVGVLVYTLCRDARLLRKVDYSLLGTFTALFIFIGNLGRIQGFHDFLLKVITDREVITAVAASQVMSNVPAAILLSGFTDHIEGLIVGTNLGGLGTMIASMASLISFKYVVGENPQYKGKYFRLFTVANVVFLVILMGVAWILGAN